MIWIERSAAWHREYAKATRMMLPFGRAPSEHLIDTVLDPTKDRAWFTDIYDVLAAITLRPGSISQRHGRSCWTASILSPATMRFESVRIVLDHDGVEVVSVHTR